MCAKGVLLIFADDLTFVIAMSEKNSIFPLAASVAVVVLTQIIHFCGKRLVFQQKKCCEFIFMSVFILYKCLWMHIVYYTFVYFASNSTN